MCAVGGLHQMHHDMPVSVSTSPEVAADMCYCSGHTDVELKLKLNFLLNVII